MCRPPYGIIRHYANNKSEVQCRWFGRVESMGNRLPEVLGGAHFASEGCYL